MSGCSHPIAACALIVCLLFTPLSGVVHAAEGAGTSTAPAPAPLLFSSPSTLSQFVTPAAMESLGSREPRTLAAASASHEEQRGYGYRRGRGRRGAAATALMIGAAAAITGTALLVYANRPECSTNQLASGCGYGTKVVGGAVLAGGVAGLAIGAALW